MQLVKWAALVKKVTTKADHSNDIVLNVGEMAPQELWYLFSFGGSSVYFLIGEQPITSENMPDIKDVIDKDAWEKSPSQRLRNVIFVYRKETMMKKYPSFDSYYKYAMNRIVDRFKENL